MVYLDQHLARACDGSATSARRTACGLDGSATERASVTNLQHHGSIKPPPRLAKAHSPHPIKLSSEKSKHHFRLPFDKREYVQRSPFVTKQK